MLSIVHIKEELERNVEEGGGLGGVVIPMGFA